jgi:hypothetical protein
MRTVSTREVAPNGDAMSGLPERVQEALGELAGAANVGLLAVSVGVRLGVRTRSWRPKSTRSWARRAGTTRIGRPSATAMRTAR